MQPRRARTALLLLGGGLAVVVISAAVASPRATDTDTDPGVTAPAAPSSVAPPATAPARGLDPGLVTALDAAVTAARRSGHDLTVTSGYRTVAEQEELLAAAIAEHGRTEALRWVFPPERSMHVRGLAVDVGDARAAGWLDDHGDRFGLCRTLAWEWWHFEWRAAWEASSTCPRPVHDPSDAPD